MAYIYGLVDPRSDKVKYVGKTVELKERLRTHIRECHKSSTPKNHWIAYLLSLGLEPRLLVIEECKDSNWKERERFWISHYPDLKNCTIGGDGGRQSAECIEKYWVGENNPACKLSRSDVVAIRKEYKTGTITTYQLGDRYGVASETVYHILVGDSWGHIGGALQREECFEITRQLLRRAACGARNGMSKLTAEEVLLIRKMSRDGVKNKELALRFNVSRGHIGLIVTRKRWNHI